MTYMTKILYLTFLTISFKKTRIASMALCALVFFVELRNCYEALGTVPWSKMKQPSKVVFQTLLSVFSVKFNPKPSVSSTI